MTLYKKHRPKTLEAVVGNVAACKMLETYLDKEDLPHCILFAGPSGCGKTTMARILAHELNCSEQDCIEVDTAVFNGVDTVRAMVANMELLPMSGGVRVYILDECHQLSSAAGNALLKALEDTPDHVYFFLCTTDPGKLLKTVRNRATLVQVRELTGDEIRQVIQRVCKREKKPMPPDAVLTAIYNACGGSARNALVILDGVIDLPEEDMKDAIQRVEIEQREAIDLCRALLNEKNKWKDVAQILSGLETEPETVRRMVLGYMANTMLKAGGGVLQRASTVVSYFEEPFFNGGRAALINACYRAMGA